jgi:hypothetical protein
MNLESVSLSQTLQSKHNCSLYCDLFNTFLPSSGALHVSLASYTSVGLKGRRVNLTTHLHVVVRLGVRGAIPPLPHTSYGTVLN